jgi:hypothetical protein
MAQKGIQEPSIPHTHLIQEANYNHKSLQLVSFDKEKAFNTVSHISPPSHESLWNSRNNNNGNPQYILIGFAYLQSMEKKDSSSQ